MHAQRVLQASDPAGGVEELHVQPDAVSVAKETAHPKALLERHSAV
eukprot:CAMPEP_0181179746 /NCGR_PEP_ID=MMETSP1096-20121128/6427_1 /TAXON_ID=156174 ORGANISM="Chrysochromulina ericina, Strain CCMP281" /NCGR_SAMPLE_ID=MMETSP1096 /ASSEMBLY_ACC=CAM_ASM_000453 /LENGTH=45 /DNA_ID= /DNA_START= /DNA_END= /DNA_ORIENTATION=